PARRRQIQARAMIGIGRRLLVPCRSADGDHVRAGNNGQMQVSWPAASPHVIAVGASTWDEQPAAYTNHGPRLDLSAPGGDMMTDANADGYPDGLLAETIMPGAPDTVGYYFAAGSSQAAALVSAAAIHLRAEGISAAQTTAVLQSGSRIWGDDWSTDAHGVGLLDVQRSLDALWATNSLSRLERSYHVVVMPWLAERDDGRQIQPRARVLLFNEDGEVRREGQTIRAVVSSEDQTQPASCTMRLLSADVGCELAGPWVDAVDASGDLNPMLWAFEVHSVEETLIRMAWRPQPAIVATDGLEVMLSALDGTGLSSSPLGFRWQASHDPRLGQIASGYTLTSLGAGFASSPIGVVFNDRWLAEHGSVETFEVSLDGTGLSSSPLGLLSLQRLTFSPTPESTRFSMLALDGTGLSSSPLGLTAFSTLGLGGDAFRGSLLGINGAALWLDSQTAPAVDLNGTALDGILREAGWVTDDGRDLATILRAQTAIDDAAQQHAPERYQP
ncbi:MAG: S8 family serine peptidase, partial [Myxococcota bacterium]